jgi:hypothetical protein
LQLICTSGFTAKYHAVLLKLILLVFELICYTSTAGDFQSPLTFVKTPEEVPPQMFEYLNNLIAGSYFKISSF